MKKLIAVIALLFTVTAFAGSGKSLAQQLGLSASSKASAQWNRVFKNRNKFISLCCYVLKTL